AFKHRNDLRMGIEAWRNSQIDKAKKCFRGYAGKKIITTMAYVCIIIYPFTLPDKIVSWAEQVLTYIGLKGKMFL
ncbi:hypothetical protein ACFL4N_09360, partial [Thermodesulfobacteriota bacterium]